MKFSLKREFSHLIVLAFMFILVIYFWNLIPDESPVHWGVDGKPDRYGSKFEALMILPLISVGMYLLLLFVPYLDKEKFSDIKALKTYDQIRLLTLLLLLGIQVTTIMQTQNPLMSFIELFIPMLGLFYLGMGVIIKQSPPNKSFINVPFELNTEESYKSLIVFIGNIFILIGVITAVSVLFPVLYAFIVFIVLNILMVIMLFVKAHSLSKAEGNL